MATFNKLILMGRLTDNPEAPRTLPNSGSTVIKFRFAVSRGKKNPQTGGWDPDPNPLYIDCEAFARPDGKRNLVELIQQYCKKGDSLFLEGRLQLDEWTDKTTNQKRSKHKMVVESLEFVGARSQDGGGDEGGGGGGSMAVRPTGGGRPAYSGGGGNAGGGGGGRPQAPPPARGGGYTPPADNDYDGGGNAGGDGEIPF